MRNNTQPTLTTEKLYEFLECRRSRVLVNKNISGHSFSHPKVEKNYAHYPNLFKYFPQQSRFARSLFREGLSEGFIHSLWYDSVGLIVQYLPLLGRVVRVLGGQYNSEMCDYDSRESLDSDSPLGWTAFNEVCLLIEVDSLYLIVQVESDGKCSSFGVLPPGITESEANEAFISISMEKRGEVGKCEILSLDEAEKRLEEAKKKGIDGEFVLVELPAKAFQSRVKFHSIDDMLEKYFDGWLDSQKV